MTAIAGVDDVIFDPTTRRFIGQVHLSPTAGRRPLRISAPGHPAWSHRRISRALIAAATSQQKQERSDADL